jgi:Methyltransferase domain
MTSSLAARARVVAHTLVDAARDRLDELIATCTQAQPLRELTRILPTRKPLPPMRGFAIAPDFALVLAQLIAAERPRLVVETGSGVSTLVIGYALEQLGAGGRVIALEHDPAYAEATRALIREHGLDAHASVVDAPLEPIVVNGEQHRWYSTRSLDSLAAIDLVVDDGPPRRVGPMLRYASLHQFAPKLAARATFVLDVIGTEEPGVLARWQRELPEFAQERVASRKGHVIVRRRRPAPSVA